MTVKFMNPASLPPSCGYTHVVQAVSRLVKDEFLIEIDAIAAIAG
jgi:hypothetical protein